MSEHIFTKKATPAAPAANKGKLFMSSTASPAALVFQDELGNLAVLGTPSLASYRLIKVTKINQGTVSYTPTTGARALFVRCIGAGGQGGGATTGVTNSAVGGGGGGGGISQLWTMIIKAFTVQVGLKGSGAAAGANGNAGTDTTFDSPSICTAKGGAGGIQETVLLGPAVGGAGGAGGVAGSGVGDVVIGGAAGDTGVVLAAAQAISGGGGDGYLGGGAGQGIKAQGAGNAASGFGAGGGGACILSGGASVAGGAGSDGLIEVWEFA